MPAVYNGYAEISKPGLSLNGLDIPAKTAIATRTKKQYPVPPLTTNVLAGASRTMLAIR
jgi:hypothetical protein